MPCSVQLGQRLTASGFYALRLDEPRRLAPAIGIFLGPALRPFDARAAPEHERDVALHVEDVAIAFASQRLCRNL
jgi:hypothetical protein